MIIVLLRESLNTLIWCSFSKGFVLEKKVFGLVLWYHGDIWSVNTKMTTSSALLCQPLGHLEGKTKIKMLSINVYSYSWYTCMNSPQCLISCGIPQGYCLIPLMFCTQSSLSVNSILYVCRITESQTELHEYFSNDFRCVIRWVKNYTLEFKTLLYIQQKRERSWSHDTWHMAHDWKGYIS